ncbi:MAG: aminoglycoside phosphotransferase family protein [Deltaproteobacteria bacterium]|nr:aminoglycoside phosphotransferase family protein [Deltaproteobacteria bacterium]
MTGPTTPAGLAWLLEDAEGAAWWQALPRVLDACARRWSLRIDAPYEGATVSYVAPATTAAGDHVVVKIQFPHRECRREADALRVWNGHGAVRLLDHAPRWHALLLERCEPGTSLADAPDVDVDALLLRLLPALLVPTQEPFTPIQSERTVWTDELTRGRAALPAPGGALVPLAIDTLDELAATQRHPVLVNQDLHRGNVLRTGPRAWAVIDPKPLLADPELALANRLPMFGVGEFAEGAEAVGERLDRLSGGLGLHSGRARAWAFVRSLMWALDDGPDRDTFIAVAQGLASS